MADTLQRMDRTPSLREQLAAWDSKSYPRAALTDRQKDALMELTTQAPNRPLPVELPLEDFPTVTPRATQSMGKDEDSGSTGFAKLKEKVENAQQFFSWFSEIEDKMESEEEELHKQYIVQLETYRGECDQMLEEITQALDHLEELRHSYVRVSTKTNALHDACEHLLAEQTKLVDTAESINNKLSYFNELERISSKLGSPTLAVTNETFIPTLSRLDECIAYISKNPQYKESSVYSAKFKQCLSRALNLIKMHVVSILQNATQQVVPQKDVTSPSDQNAFTLFYGKFRTNAPRVKMLMEQIEARLEKSPEYQQLLTDCHNCYFTQRESLLAPSVASAISDLASKHIRDQCALVRSGCSFMVHVCEDENQLYYHFFTKPTPLLDIMLEGLCNNLYDVFRPLIIHINHLETLAELCSILKVEMLEEHVLNNPSQLAAFETVCAQMLEDVQERLAYRTHIYIRSEILNYHPAEGDLAYPEKLEMMESIAESIKKGELSRHNSTSSTSSLEVAQINAQAEPVAGPSDQGGATEEAAAKPKAELFVNVSLTESALAGVGGNMPMSPADLHGMWYPTVRRTLVCLSKLYRCIDRTTFQGLSQETLSMCIQSLITANQSVAKRKTLIDGQMFLIKHLLILREQIAPFQVDFAVKETSLDFSKIKDAAVGLLYSRSKLFTLSSNNALLQFLLDGTPQVMETFVDSKKDVDNQLKKTCEEFIHHITDHFIGPLKMFLTKANTITEMQHEEGAPKVSLRQQPFASPEKVHDVVAETYRNLKTRLTGVQAKMSLYLANKDTEYILFKPIKANVQQNFQQLQHILKDYSDEDLQIVACPSLEQINLLLSTQPTVRHGTPQL